jgi:hypothetical protein
MSREQLLNAIIDFAGPLGPFGSIESLERRRQSWIDAADIGALLEAMLDLANEPPSDAQIRPVRREWFELELQQLLEMLGRRGQRDQALVLAALSQWLGKRRARCIAIETIGGLRACQGLTWLVPLVSVRASV